MKRVLHFVLRAVLAGTLLCLVPGCHNNQPKEVFLADFESDAGLDKLQWSCRTLYSVSNEHATRGTKSLRMDLYPSDYPGLSFAPEVKDWRRYRALSFDVFVPADDVESINVRIDDASRRTHARDQYNEQFGVRQGANTIVIPLSALVSSNDGSPLDLSRISRVIIFLISPKMKTTLYIDAVRLE
ncbi:MAG TPA: hypothetical protein VLH56_10520 [Dissulfurispiraceae bacterium]|nr:hypothetical protein [Dissulfurispiraceae bacterium]